MEWWIWTIIGVILVIIGIKMLTKNKHNESVFDKLKTFGSACCNKLKGKDWGI